MTTTSTTNIGPVRDHNRGLAASLLTVFMDHEPANDASVVGSPAYWQALFAQGDAYEAELRAAKRTRGNPGRPRRNAA